ncbi:MAG: hypothetical protein QM751_06235 [Paludibacteraceae bacterium]
MWYESRLKPNAKNPKGSASGLIQFVEKTAIGLGTTTVKLRAMSNVQQLDYVYKYFLPYKGKVKNIYDAYAVVFLPIALGKPDNWIMQGGGFSAAIIKQKNPAVKDINKDGVLSKSEFNAYVDKLLLEMSRY